MHLFSVFCWNEKKKFFFSLHTQIFLLIVHLTIFGHYTVFDCSNQTLYLSIYQQKYSTTTTTTTTNVNNCSGRLDHRCDSRYRGWVRSPQLPHSVTGCGQWSSCFGRFWSDLFNWCCIFNQTCCPVSSAFFNCSFVTVCFQKFEPSASELLAVTVSVTVTVAATASVIMLINEENIQV